MPDAPSDIRQGNEKIPKKGTLDKYKWWLVGGLAVIAVAVFYFTRQSNANSSTSQGSSATAPGIDPATGQPYALEYSGFGGTGFGGGTQGPAGPAGPRGGRGPRGPRGPRGKGGKGGGGDHDHKGKRGALAPFTPQGRMIDNARARAMHNSRIVPAATRGGPGMPD